VRFVEVALIVQYFGEDTFGAKNLIQLSGYGPFRPELFARTTTGVIVDNASGQEAKNCSHLVLV